MEFAGGLRKDHAKFSGGVTQFRGVSRCREEWKALLCLEFQRVARYVAI